MTDGLHLIDPEILIPSPSSVLQLEFWERLYQWAEYPDLCIGQASVEPFYELVDSLPRIPGFVEADFWKCFNMLVGRLHSGSDIEREFDLEHLRLNYSPTLGRDDNVELLLGDIRATGNVDYVVVNGPEGQWGSEHELCDICKDSGLYFSSQSPAQLPRLVDAIACRTLFMLEEPTSFVELEAAASRLFPSIDFSTTAWTKVSGLEGEKHQNLPAIVHHLSILNDHASKIWETSTQSDIRRAHLGSLGVDASIESVRTHKNAAAMKERDFAFGSRVVRCEWHTKIRPNVNRIHFEVERGRVKVGIIVRHLAV